MFDSVKMRVDGTEAAKFVINKKKKPERVKPNNWRVKHEEFLQTVRYAKTVSKIEKNGGDIRLLPKPPASLNLDYVQCPNCGRKFNEKAASRHLPLCKEKAQMNSVKQKRLPLNIIQTKR